MSHGSPRDYQQKGTADRFLEYVGKAGIAITLVLALAAAGVAALPVISQGGLIGLTVVSLGLLGAVLFLMRYLHKQYGREMNPDPDWH